jgi:hypothetical protein
MGIQINGQTDTISAADGGLTVSGADLGSASAGSLNVTGIVTATSFVGNLTGNINSSGISTVTNLRVGTAVTANSDGIQVGAGKSIRIFGSASGYSNLVASSVAGASELLLPSTGGTIDRLNRAGNILQVVQGTLSSGLQTTSTSFVATGLSATITPSSASNKILITVAGGSIYSQINNFAILTIYRGGTDLFSGNTSGAASQRVRTGDIAASLGLSYLDSPSTTSSTTYAVYLKASAGTVEYPAPTAAGSASAAIILMEVAA